MKYLHKKKTTSSNLNLWHVSGIFVRYLSTKLPPNDVVKGRVVCNILFSTPLRILGESPSQSVRGSKMFCVPYWSLAFYLCAASSGVNGVLRIYEMRILDGTGLTHLRTQSNLRTSLPCTTSLVVAGSKAYCNDQLWKTSVESHLVKHILHTHMHTYINEHLAWL